MAATYPRNDSIIRHKFYQYLIPTVLMVLALQFGSLADAIIVGQFLGGDALSASSLALPIVFLVELPGFAIAAGAGIVGANFIGKRMIKEASQTFKVSMLLSFAVSLAFVPIGIFLSEHIATWLAGNFQELKPMISQYVQIFMYQAPILGAGLTLAYFLPSDNCPNLGAAYFIVSNLAHLTAEILFALFLDPSVAMYGVAASTGIGMLAGFVVLIPYFKSKKRTIDLTTPIKGGFALFKGVLKAGSSTAALTALSFVYYLVLNLAASAYLTAGEMPVYAMLSNFSFVIDLFLIGVLQVMPSVLPALYGEKDYFSVRAITRRVFGIGMGVAATLTIVSAAFPQLFFWIFGVNLQETIDAFAATGSALDPLWIIRIYVFAFVVYAVNKFAVYYYPAVMVNSPGVVNNVVRFGLVGPVTIYFLMRGMGVLGFAIGNIIMEVAALALTGLFLFIGLKMGKFPGRGLLLLPKNKDVEDTLDLSIPAKQEEVSAVVEQLQQFALKLGDSAKSAGLLALAAEEILVNTIAYGYKKKHSANYIDVNLSRDADHLLIRIRDDGMAFDPTTYQPEEAEDMAYGGIEVARAAASEFKYLRVLNTNNTIMEINIAA